MELQLDELILFFFLISTVVLVHVFEMEPEYIVLWLYSFFVIINEYFSVVIYLYYEYPFFSSGFTLLFVGVLSLVFLSEFLKYLSLLLNWLVFPISARPTSSTNLQCKINTILM